MREKDIRNFIGAMSGDTNKGVFVTTSLFDKGAVEKAKKRIGGAIGALVGYGFLYAIIQYLL